MQCSHLVYTHAQKRTVRLGIHRTVTRLLDMPYYMVQRDAEALRAKDAAKKVTQIDDGMNLMVLYSADLLPAVARMKRMNEQLVRISFLC